MSQLRRLTNEEAEHKRELLAREYTESMTEEEKDREQYYQLHPMVRDFHELMEG